MYKLITASALSFLAFLLWIIYLANTGRGSIFFDLVESIPYGDKAGHLGLFGFLTLVSILSLKFRTFRLGSYSVYLGAAFVFVFAVGEEITQVFVPYRTFDLVDVAADLLGILLAVALASFLRSKFGETPTQKRTVPPT